MYPVSSRWDACLRSSHEVVSRAEVWRSGVFTGTTLSLLGGEVRVDESSKVRRALTLDSADVDLMPDDLGDFLSPTDTDLKVFSGVRYTEGDTELVPVGVFRIETPSRSSLLAPLSIEGGDYSAVLARARFIAPWNVTKGTRVVAAITAMVRDVLPWVDIIDLTGRRTYTPAVVFDRDRWDAIEDLAASIGCEAAFGADGDLIIRPTPTAAAVSAWDVDSETETSVLLDAGVSLSTASVYNAVVATSSDADRPPVSAALIQNKGPLRWRAGFKQPRFYSSPVLRTRSDCLRAALSILVRSLAYSQKLTPTAAPNPALDVGDTVSVKLPGRPAVLRVVARVTIPLSLDAMPLDVRASVDSLELEGLS